MTKLTNWFKNNGTDLVALILLPFLALLEGILLFVDMFADSEGLTSAIKWLSNIKIKLLEIDGTKDKETK